MVVLYNHPAMKKLFTFLFALVFSSSIFLSSVPPAHAQGAFECAVDGMFDYLVGWIPGIGTGLAGITIPDGPWYNQNTCQFKKKVFEGSPENEIFGERYTYAQVNWIIHSLRINLDPFFQLGPRIQDLLDYILAENRSPTFSEYAQFGLPGILIGTMADGYNARPISGIQTIQTQAYKFFDIAAPVQSS